MSVGKQEGNLDEFLFCDFEGFRVVLVCFSGKNCGSIGAAGTATDGAALLSTIGALEIARVPGSTGVWMTWIWLSGIIVVAVVVGSSSQIALLRRGISVKISCIRREELTRSGRWRNASGMTENCGSGSGVSSFCFDLPDALRSPDFFCSDASDPGVVDGLSLSIEPLFWREVVGARGEPSLRIS